jgi:GTP-binding protein LepA
MMSTGAVHELLEIGVVSPEMEKAGALGVGEVGYLITGVKDVRQSRVGDTVTGNNRPATEPLGGYKDPKPMVYSGLYPIDGSDYPALRDALDKLKLNDAALVYEPETSAALGFGFRCGFLGLLHLEIIGGAARARVHLDLISTAPNVVYRSSPRTRRSTWSPNPSEFPTGKIAEIHEPVVRATVLVPNDYVGAVMELCQSRRGQLLGMEYLSASGSSCATRCRSPRSSSTSSTSSRARPRGTRRWTTNRPASRSPTWSRWTSCCTASRWTLQSRSCTRTRRTTTASPSPRSCRS